MHYVRSSLVIGRRLVVALLAVVFMALAVLGTAGTAEAKVPDSQQGITIQPKTVPGQDPRLDFASNTTRQAFYDMKVNGFGIVDLTFPLSQAGITATTIGPRKDTPTDAALIAGIQNAHKAGLKVSLKPHLEPGEWRAHITFGTKDDPSHEDTAKANAWQAAWDAQLLHYARIAQDNHVEMFVVGVEQRGTVLAKYGKGNPARWINTVKEVRKVYKGKVTYSGHMPSEGLKLDPKFVGTLDYVGMTMYPRVTFDGKPTVARLKASLKDTYTKPWFAAMSKRYNGKKVNITEIGFRSVSVKDQYVTGDLSGTTIDTDLQDMEYQAALDYLKPLVAGIQTYRWDTTPGAGGLDDPNLTIQGKPAQKTVAKEFGGLVPTKVVLTTSKPAPGQLLVQAKVDDSRKLNTYSAVYQIDGGSWHSLKDSSSDPTHKSLTVDVSNLAAGPHDVVVRTKDSKSKRYIGFSFSKIQV